MPMYEYRCPECSYEFEAMQPIAHRDLQPCNSCDFPAIRVMLTAPRLDPNADLPSQRDLWRRKAEARGRGADMTAANKTVEDETTLRDAHAARAARGENPIINT